MLATTQLGQGMGIERRPFTVKLDAANEELVEQIRLAHLPFEVSRSSIVNSLVTIARTQIQVTPASVQQTPRNLSNTDLSADSGSGQSALSDLTNAARQQSRGGRASRVDGLPGTISPNLAIDAASNGTASCAREGSACQELPVSPQKAVRRRAEKSA